MASVILGTRRAARAGQGALRSAAAGASALAGRSSSLAKLAVSAGMTEAFADTLTNHPNPGVQTAGHALRMTGLALAATGVVVHGGALVAHRGDVPAAGDLGVPDSPVEAGLRISSAPGEGK